MMAVIDSAPSDTRTLRNALERRRWQLMEELRLKVARIRDQRAEPLHTDDPDDDSTDLDVMLVEITTQMLQIVDAAIDRLDRGQYGRCARCRGRISDVRLRAMPFAVHCRECQTTREREAALGQANDSRRPWNRSGEDPPQDRA
jgi:DnaK suppressor protein